MTDRTGAIYAALGGLAVGLLATFLPSVTGRAAVGISFAIAVAAYCVVAPVADWYLPWRKKGVAVVISQARTVAHEISQFAAASRRTAPLNDPRPESWAQDNQRMMLQSASFMADYEVRFSVRALVAFDRLVALGAVPAGTFDRLNVEHPTNPLGVEQVARELGVMAATLETKALR